MSELDDISKDSEGKVKEVEITELNQGQYSGAFYLMEGVRDPLITHTHAVSLFAIKHNTVVIKISKDRYRKAIDENKTRIRNAKLEFLKKVELMKQFTRNSLKNIARMFEVRKLNRHQMLYREGERADRVFFVIKGELKVTKKVFLIDKKQEEHRGQVNAIEQTGQVSKANIFPVKRNNNKKMTRKKQVLDLFIVTTNGMLCEEDIFIETENNRYITSCVCVSKEAEVFELKQEDFLKEGKKQQNWLEILEKMKQKRHKFAQRVHMKNEVQKTVGSSAVRRERDSQDEES